MKHLLITHISVCLVCVTWIKLNHAIGFDLLHFYGPHSLLEYPEVFLFMIPFLKMKWRFFKNNIFVKMKSLIVGFSNPANKHKTFFLFSLHIRACINSFTFLSWYTIKVTKNTINSSNNKSIGNQSIDNTLTILISK